jgi:hypothetical protein
MAHFAQIDENNIVINVVKTDNNDPNNDEGYQWLIDNIGGRWIKTSYNTYRNEHTLGGTPLRGHYAGVGMVYDEERDVFLYPKPYPSWILREDILLWDSPVEQPVVESIWDEETLSWIEVTNG